MNKLYYYLFDRIPGAWEGWTLAVLAVSQHDARRYVNAHNGNGRYLGKKERPGEKDAHCGAITEAASEVVRQKNALAGMNL